MQSFAGKVVVITGAGSGIGRALAQYFAKAGSKLALADWHAENLQTTVDALPNSPNGAEVLSQSFDVSDLAAFTAFRDDLLQQYDQVDVIINNAGVALAQTIDDVSIEDFEWVMGINFWGMVYGTKLFLPELKKRPEAAVANVSSVFGLISVPTQGTYNASKFAIRGVTEALWHELDNTNVTALSIHPGGIKTNIVRNAKFFTGPTGGRDHARNIKQFDKMARTTPEKAAALIGKAIRKKKKRLLIGPDAVIIDRLQRLNPLGYWAVFKTLLPK